MSTMSDKDRASRNWSETQGDPAPKGYSVTLWESEPGENDDCNTGCDFSTLEEARACIADLWSHFNRQYYISTPFILLDGIDGTWEVTRNPDAPKGKKKKDNSDDEWRREIAMQDGMMGGCQAYNEAMGWDEG